MSLTPKNSPICSWTSSAALSSCFCAFSKFFFNVTTSFSRLSILNLTDASRCVMLFGNSNNASFLSSATCKKKRIFEKRCDFSVDTHYQAKLQNMTIKNLERHTVDQFSLKRKIPIQHAMIIQARQIQLTPSNSIFKGNWIFIE